ncbi:MAG: recombination mediator RecR, partial [Patescibacteria group bacterium]|nr:recombination mediator RecR [Patescibacteria group bacterium]
QNLINLFSNFPSVGPKTAERYVFYLLNHNPEFLQQLAQAIAELKEKSIVCKTCFAVSESNPCEICSNKNRDHSVICVIANTRDMLSIEATKQYQGYYHVLGGLLSAIKGIDAKKLNFNFLLDRIKNNQINEVILAFSSNIDGETTAMYLAKLLKSYNIKITRLAKGLPTGADLEYADEITLANALKFRNKI